MMNVFPANQSMDRLTIEASRNTVRLNEMKMDDNIDSQMGYHILWKTLLLQRTWDRIGDSRTQATLTDYPAPTFLIR
jgi:hypothetical protein